MELKRAKVSTNVIAVLFVIWWAPLSYAEYVRAGLAVYSDLNLDYFVTELYVSAGEAKGDISNPQIRRKIVIRIVPEKIFSRRFTRIWINGASINSEPGEFYANTENFVQFARAFDATLQYGDQVVFDYDPRQGTYMQVNGVARAFFSGSDIFDMFLRVLLGDVPLSSPMKQALLSIETQSQGEKARRLLANMPVLKTGASSIQDLAQASPSSPSTYTPASGDAPPLRIGAAQVGHRAPLNNLEQRSTATEAAEPKKPIPNAVPSQQMVSSVNQAAADLHAADRHQQQSRGDEQTLALLTTPASKGDMYASSFKEAVLPEVAPDEPLFLFDELIAEQDYAKQICSWVSERANFPVLVADRPEAESIKFSVRIGRDGQLLAFRQFEESKFAKLNKGAVRLIQKSAPFPDFPEGVREDEVDVDLYFHLHWRYRQ